jgi:hypothetical protein
MSQNTKPNQSATEKLARVIERCGPGLLTNVSVALSPLPMSAKAGFALLTTGSVMIDIVIGASAWLIRTKL